MENPLIDGRYLLLAAIGAGGEARVFNARDQVLGNDVALRIARHHAAPTTTERPPTAHAGWVQLIATGSDLQYGAYQVFELLEGRTLRELIQTSQLGHAQWRDFVDQSLAAVEALHSLNFVHGDINADNFFQTDLGWKLLELPFLRLDPPAGRSAVFGSIHTLAPEQIDGASPSVQTDIYALGCLYYYAASGTYPHPGSTAAEVAISCLRFAPLSLREKAPQLSVAWSDWVMKLIAPKPDDRPASIFAARQLLGVA